MRIALYDAAALLVAACAPTPQISASGQPLAQEAADMPTLEHRVMSWGRTLRSVEISTDGALAIRNYDFSTQTLTSTQQRRLTPAGHRAAIRALEPLRSSSSRSVYCADAPTDGPSGIFSWNGENTYTIYYPCLEQFPELSAAETAFQVIVMDDDNFLTDED